MLNSVRKRYLGCLAGIFSLALASSQLPSGPDAEPDVLVLKGRVIDGTGAAPLEQGLVILAAGKIQYIGKQGSRDYPATARVLDVGDGTILPGLIDLHVHLRPHYWDAFLPAGITTVRDANNALATLRTLQQDTAARPRLLYTGPMLDGPTTIMKRFFPDSLVARYVRPATAGPIGELIAQQVETPAQARAAVDSLAAHGASFVKLYEQLPLAAYQAAAAQARKRGLRVMTDLGMLQTRGLKGAQVDALQALQAGVHSIEHASGYALAYQRLGGDPMAPLDTRLIDQLARATVRGRTTLVPTLSVFYGTVQPDSARQDLATLPGGKAIPAPMMAWFEQQARQHTPASRGRASADLRLAQALVRRVHQLGGLIGAGTDVPAGDYNLPGGNLHRELALLVEAGLPPVAAIQAATGTAARLLGLPTLGTLRRGNLADVVVVAGNPAQDIRATRRVRYVIQAGRVLTLQ
ncbi:hypothetical protein E5K00_16995 [Hymenobacter aquaticus]|uniref:Amidohydrolase-related domain-containing protein n=1 Tax=Hymenobacter aquaticus TaxID=1867101 RepID=A0A4Z0PXE3_9BACT|nr:amidohydrolase family protein [Hymenobacter aquaticus]TGE21954.1 hypothetical protein E5K00_16995 [Hymenobacter aquaticus]